VVCGHQHGFDVYELPSGCLLCSGPASDEHVTAVTLASFQDAVILATATGNGFISAWRMEPTSCDLSPIVTDRIDDDQQVRAMVIARRGGERLLVAGDLRGFAYLWHLTTGKRIEPRLLPECEGKSIEAMVAVSHDSENSFVVSGGGTWNIVSWFPQEHAIARDGPIDIGTNADESGHADYVRCLAVGDLPPHGRVLVSGSDDATVRFWSLPRLEPRGRPLAGHRNWIYGVGVGILDGSAVIVSGARDGSIRVWSSDGDLVEAISIEEEVLGLSVGSSGMLAVCTQRGIVVLKLRQ
jgi:WD40 repeat protein